MEKQERLAIIEDLLSRNIDNIVDKEHLKARLLKGEKLRVKFGIDPTSPNIHLGRAVAIMKLRKFQQLGCQIVLIIGDFTGVIGDTSDKTAERPMLSQKVVKENLKTYLKQFGKLVNIKKTEVHYNSKWLKKLNYWQISEQADSFSLNEFISRSNIKTRLENESRISLRELLYPMMQGYDSVVVKSDLEIGGQDQWFNLLAGRTMQKKYGQEPQDILTNKLLIGLDGRKMSSSWGNTINLNDTAENMYGKVMSMSDELIVDYFKFCTELPLSQIAEYEQKLKDPQTNPRDIKSILAYEITKIYHGEDGAKKGADYFDAVVRNKEIPQDIPELRPASYSLVEILVESKLATSKSDARRAIEQGGVKFEGDVVKDINYQISKEGVVQKGKRGFVKIKK